jgi:hypothetical protein
MTDRSACIRAPRLHRILAGPMALSLVLSLAASGCSPGPGPSEVEGGVTSKVPEIAKRQKHMEEMLKKGASTAKSSTEPH